MKSSNRRLSVVVALLVVLPWLVKADSEPCISTTSNGDALAQQRIVNLEGAQNFRDLGGYCSTDGRRVKWGLLYRSGSLHNLTARDYESLERLGVRVISDFRSTAERKREPLNWLSTRKMPAVLAEDYEADAGRLGQVLADPEATEEQAREAFAEIYAQLPYRLANQYRRMFDELLTGNAPLIFNCSGGKDRTGVAAALLLSALGIPRDVVMRDFLLSNETFDPKKSLATDPTADALWRQLPPELMRIVMGVEQRYLDAAFEAINVRSGSLNNYFERELGLTAADIARLRELYLE